ncbi:MAG TPA: hypothetical protein ENL09_02180 [Bacteroidetes bacterium]|nr:hypothetical protein [Bacteroidota bacterium]
MQKTIIILFLFLLLFCANTIFGEESKEKKQTGMGKFFLIELSEQDKILPIILIEWGQPDRWSFTSRYIHDFHKEKTSIPWRNNAGIFLSPGISGGRLGISYLGIYTPSSESLQGTGLLSEIRAVMLRTWGNPLSTSSDTTFAGAEIKLSFFVFNISAGYYSPLAIGKEDVSSFFGFHFGIGV